MSYSKQNDFGFEYIVLADAIRALVANKYMHRMKTRYYINIHMCAYK